ncbi:group III truncated hemoglobin [Hyphococcus sp.]|uniref:group III truncated hemoglobin n=1 Tax=Hyphococcus sp. TaxID=2038636 RepID=UPI003CCC4553
MSNEVQTADERRKAIQVGADELGIDDAYISTLVDTFYGKVRAHPLLGPVFDEKIGDNWDVHLTRMKDFWASVAMNAGRYSGKPVPKHKALSRAQPWHFNIWLALFHETLEETAPAPGAVPYFMERAERIAESLQLAMFGVAGLGAPKPQTEKSP